MSCVGGRGQRPSDRWQLNANGNPAFLPGSSRGEEAMRETHADCVMVKVSFSLYVQTALACGGGCRQGSKALLSAVLLILAM